MVDKIGDIPVGLWAETGKLITTVGRPAEHHSRRVWVAALIVAGIGAYVMYAALPGVNWGIWTAAA